MRANAAESAEDVAAKERNYGLSKNYDSVFRASSDGEPAPKMSKKEKKRMEELDKKLSGKV